MLFNLNEFLMAVSFALDFVEMDLFGVVTNHSKRVAYVSMKIAQELGLPRDEIFDLISLSILHDNGASEKFLQDRISSMKVLDRYAVESLKEHGMIGERNIKHYPFINNVENIIKYHHENYDGTGFFRLKGDEIPLMSQIIKLSDMVEVNTNLRGTGDSGKLKAREFVKSHENTLLSPKVVRVFSDAMEAAGFTEDLCDENIDRALKQSMPYFSRELSFKDIHGITKVLSKIIDSKSKFTQSHSLELSQKAARMAEYYKKEEDEVYKLVIAADLHDIGKLAVSNSILDKPGKLDESEFNAIKKHPYLTRVCLQQISGFEEITEWASNHHEKLNGMGYPFGKNGSELDFNSRLLACLDIYQACTEDRPYRKAMTHCETMEILWELGNSKALDLDIITGIDKVFS